MILPIKKFQSDLSWVIETKNDKYLMSSYESNKAVFMRWGLVDFSFTLRIKEGEPISRVMEKIERSTRKSGFTIRTFPSKKEAIKYLKKCYNPF